MDMRTRIIAWSIIFITMQYCSDGMLNLKKTEGSFCFEVENSSLANTSLSLILEVKYPFSIAEAGQITLGEEDLTPGTHVVSYRYLITNMTHDLIVRLDNIQKKFIKTKIPRWYTVSFFYEVVLMHQGRISILPCLNESLNEWTNSDRSKPSEGTSDSDEENFFIKDDRSIFEPSYTAQVASAGTTNAMNNRLDYPNSYDAVNASTSYSTHKGFPLRNITKSVTSHFRTTTTTTTTAPKPRIGTTSTTTTNSSSLAAIINATNIPLLNKTKNSILSTETKSLLVTNKSKSSSTPSSNFERDEHIPPTILYSLNYTHFEKGRSETSQSCRTSGDCGGYFGQDYTVAFILFGILGVMVVIAIVISVVFHRKKKKIMVPNRAKPNNRLRQKILENEIEGESLLMIGFKGPEHHSYEQMP